MAKQVDTSEARRGLRILRDIISQPMIEAGRVAMQPMLEDAKATVPRRTGRLARRLAVVRVRTGSRLRVRYLLGVVGRSKEEHAEMARLSTILEFGRQPNKSGRGGFPPFAWLRKVIERHKDRLVPRYAVALQAALERRLQRFTTRK